MSITKIKLKISGKVQGVFYRQSTKEKAAELNLSGYVSNQNDGSVLIEAIGDKDNLEKLEKWCWQGPQRSKVTNVELIETCELTKQEIESIESQKKYFNILS